MHKIMTQLISNFPSLPPKYLDGSYVNLQSNNLLNANQFPTIEIGCYKGYKDTRRLRCYRINCRLKNLAHCNYCKTLPLVPSPLRNVTNFKPNRKKLVVNYWQPTIDTSEPLQMICDDNMDQSNEPLTEFDSQSSDSYSELTVWPYTDSDIASLTSYATDPFDINFNLYPNNYNIDIKDINDATHSRNEQESISSSLEGLFNHCECLKNISNINSTSLKFDITLKDILTELEDFNENNQELTLSNTWLVCKHYNYMISKLTKKIFRHSEPNHIRAII